MEPVEMVKYAQMDMLNEVRRICWKHDIPYFLIGGTLIGAIRHQGFIPWDDDIDIGMLRADYDRFAQVCREELDPAYGLYDWDVDPHSPLPFLKMKIKGTHYREAVSVDSKMNDEIYIDIFPYDNAPDSEFLRSLQAWRIYLIRKLLMLRCGFTLHDGKAVKKILYGTLNFLSRIRSVAAWKKSCHKLMLRYNDRQTRCISNMCGAYTYRREMMDRTLVQEQIPHVFEGDMYSIPAGYDAFLKGVYGDYMQLPPESERAGKHGISLIDLGGYVIRWTGKGENP